MIGQWFAARLTSSVRCFDNLKSKLRISKSRSQKGRAMQRKAVYLQPPGFFVQGLQLKPVSGFPCFLTGAVAPACNVTSTCSLGKDFTAPTCKCSAIRLG